MTEETRKPGLYWVKWAAEQEWDVGSYSGPSSNGHNWWAIGTDEWQEEPAIIGPALIEPS